LDFLHFDLARGVMTLIPMLLSLTVHEWAHAWSAYRLGDDTASMQGRLTLNPMAHIDPVGTLILPLLGVPFGWAKPVPVNPTRFRRGVNMSRGMMITAAAGPLSNVALAILSAIVIGLLARFMPEVMTSGKGLGVTSLLINLLVINVTLAIFNLIPIPPLDGSRIVDGLVPHGWRPQWQGIVRLSPLLLLVVMIAGQRLIAGPAGYCVGLLSQLVEVIRS
jgi:Zn-dependent protease